MGGSFTIQNEFNGFGCNGNNASPIKLENAPEGTKSFAITCYDQMRLQEQDGGIG
jgi:phosphatidylethanolamine-binding protein (PEBP) family uncharacterized protein